MSHITWQNRVAHQSTDHTGLGKKGYQKGYLGYLGVLARLMLDTSRIKRSQARQRARRATSCPVPLDALASLDA
jgi:hypothetical protein